jgi:hypothetical protein
VPIVRIASQDTPVPFSTPVEEFFLPKVSDVVWLSTSRSTRDHPRAEPSVRTRGTVPTLRVHSPVQTFTADRYTKEHLHCDVQGSAGREAFL